MRCQKKRCKRYGSYDHRGIIPNQVSIDEWPAIVEARGRFGDWEGDTVVGKRHRGARVMDYRKPFEVFFNIKTSLTVSLKS
ncbi:MAG: hypothetical protein RQ826_07810 [Xanthomonadales bacterium]|nr:hypothetical protein [Xanthomonadales bacterium]